MELTDTQRKFVLHWGEMGSRWGINRTVAQIHALLLVSPDPLSTDQIMEALKISRGNAHANLKELQNWGLISSVVIKGERKEFFQAEKDIWKMFCIIARERKRREVEPALKALRTCAGRTEDHRCPHCREFNRQMENLSDFASTLCVLLDKIADAESNRILPRLLKMLD